MALESINAPSPLVAEATAETFRELVIDASMQALVLVDFWAEWCGPCKSLTPLLEKLVADYQGRVRLVKIDVDKNQMLAGQFRVQSIPTVYAFGGGRPLDGFMGALPESQLRAFIDRLLQAMGGEDLAHADGGEDMAALLEAAETAALNGDHASAETLFGDILDIEPENLQALTGLARARCAAGDLPGAKALLERIPEESANDPAVVRARATVALAAEAKPVADLDSLRAHVEANPNDHEKRYELAGGLMAVGDQEGAADQLLEIIQRDRNWNGGEAKARLLRMFDAIGLENPFTKATRRRLSSVLFS
ncbi:thioredoxin [Pedomonas mirosovicensis]|uniref:thioredoxin n=1 Tax=Pedomonas mirosovicensis TaxID=2908641 RepID=UPI002169C6C9|nr:thioredoxin [Pedomonas mirosovicensis]MCH8684133.1 thioredoxin [Pedomonas mirosovicensis]